MHWRSYQVKTVLDHSDARKKIFLEIKDSLGNPLGLPAIARKPAFIAVLSTRSDAPNV